LNEITQRIQIKTAHIQLKTESQLSVPMIS